MSDIDIKVNDPNVQKIIDALPTWPDLVKRLQRRAIERREFAAKVFGKAWKQVEESRRDAAADRSGNE